MVLSPVSQSSAHSVKYKTSLHFVYNNCEKKLKSHLPQNNCVLLIFIQKPIKYKQCFLCSVDLLSMFKVFFLLKNAEFCVCGV